MTITARVAGVLGIVAVAALAVRPVFAIAGSALVVVLVVVDAASARRPLRLHRSAPTAVVRGRPTSMRVRADGSPGRVTVRQASAALVAVEPETASGELEATLTARARGRHVLAPPAARQRGPLGLGAWLFDGDGPLEVDVYPDIPSARRIARSVRAGRFRQAGQRSRGPLGLGTDFESIREYVPDDDIRQVNWSATARTGRPMSNQYRVEQDRDVICVVDTGRLMQAPVQSRSRLDAALDAVVAICAVADAVGDRCGAVAFDTEVRRRVVSRRFGSRAVTAALFDLDARPVDSDYDVAFRAADAGKRSLVVVFTDILDASAARSLVGAVPILTRRHAVIVASSSDPALEAVIEREPRTARDVYRRVATLPLVEARASVEQQLRHFGAEVVEAAPSRLAEACVTTYLRLKSRGRI